MSEDIGLDPEIFETDNKLIYLDEEGAHIIARSVAEKLENKKISASMVTGLLGETGCAARWLADSFVIQDLIEEEPDSPARRGSLFHKVMEDLFALEPEERTKVAVKQLVVKTLKSDEFSDLAHNKDVVQWLKDAINGYYNMGGKPEKVQVAEIVIDESRGPQKGLEIFVKGRIGNAKREVLGFIDRLVLNTVRNDGSLIVEDYKSGAKAKKWKSHTKSDEGLAEQRQQLIYKMLLEQKGFKVSGARLLYPVAGEIVNVDIKDKELAERVVQDVEETDRKLDVMIENNTFEYNPSFLCSWCSLARLCPKSDIKPYKKMQDAFQSQPEPTLLMKVIDMR